MKTSVVLKSVDRELFGVTISQETSSEMLSITDLQRAYNAARIEYGWSDREFDSINRTKDFRERLYYVLKEQGLPVPPHISGFTELVEKEGIVKTMKNYGVYRVKGRDNNRHAMANPYVWMLVALEMNPMIYAKVVVWLTDTLIMNRIEAGDNFKPMNTAIQRIIDKPEYYVYAMAINEKVFGRHMAGIRNLASKEQLKSIARIEDFITTAITMGYIKTHQQILEAIKNWNS